MTKKHKNATSSRPFDFIYDPLYIVAAPEDHRKNILHALMKTAEYTIHPIFGSMFSDHYPRCLVIPKRGFGPDPSFLANLHIENLERAVSDFKIVEVGGADRFKFYQKPNVQYLKPFVVNTFSSLSLDQKSFDDISIFPSKAEEPSRKKLDVILSDAKKRARKIARASKGTQTDYRESETQTVPWTPPFFVVGCGTPEVLRFSFNPSGIGFPSIEELEVIDRTKKRLAWENVLSSSMKGKEDINSQRKILDDLEKDEWEFKKKRIDKVHAERMSLALEHLDHLKTGTQKILKKRLRNAIAFSKKEEKLKLVSLQNLRERALRKLNIKYRGLIGTPIKEKKVEGEEEEGAIHFYNIDKISSFMDTETVHIEEEYIEKYESIIKREEFEVLEPTMKFESEMKFRMSSKIELCNRLTKFNETTLEVLHAELKNKLKKGFWI